MPKTQKGKAAQRPSGDGVASSEMFSEITAAMVRKVDHRLSLTPRRLTVDIKGDVAEALDRNIAKYPGLKRADVMRDLLVGWLKSEGALPSDYEY